MSRQTKKKKTHNKKYLITDRLIFFPNGLTPKLKQQFKQEKLKKKQQRQQRKKQNQQTATTKTSTTTTTLKQRHHQQQHYNHQQQHYNISQQHHHMQQQQQHQQHHQYNTYVSHVGGRDDESENLNNNNNNNNNIEDFNSDYMEIGGSYQKTHYNTDNENAVAANDDNIDDDNYDDEDDDDGDYEENDYDDLIRAEIYSNYPHYLHPPSWGLNNPLVLASHSPQTYDDDVVIEIGEHKPTSSSIGVIKHQQKQMQQITSTPSTLHLDDLEHSVDDVVVVVDTGARSHKNNIGGISVGIGTIQTTGLGANDIYDMHRQTYYTHNDDILYKQQHQQQQLHKFNSPANVATATTTSPPSPSYTLYTSDINKQHQNKNIMYVYVCVCICSI